MTRNGPTICCFFGGFRVLCSLPTFGAITPESAHLLGCDSDGKPRVNRLRRSRRAPPLGGPLPYLLKLRSFVLRSARLEFATRDTLRSVINVSNNRIFVDINEIERESFSYCVSTTDGLQRLQDSICIHVLAWMRYLGFSRANSLVQKQRRLLYHWHVAEKALKSQCWMRCGGLRIDYFRCSSRFRRVSRR